jgi:hypothetical protein
MFLLLIGLRGFSNLLDSIAVAACVAIGGLPQTEFVRGKPSKGNGGESRLQL